MRHPHGRVGGWGVKGGGGGLMGSWSKLFFRIIWKVICCLGNEGHLWSSTQQGRKKVYFLGTQGLF